MSRYDTKAQDVTSHDGAREIAAPGPGKRTLADAGMARDASPPVQARASAGAGASVEDWQMTPGLLSAFGLDRSSDDPAQVQRLATSEPAPASGALGRDVSAIAGQGVAGASASLPHLDAIQASFGDHDVSGIRAQVGGAATEAASAIGAQAYATGDRVAFAGAPDLHTAAHEAAHVVQQRAGVHLKGGVGEVGDPYEQHADQVADLVVQGRSAEAMLEAGAGAAGGGGAVQRKPPSGGAPDGAGTATPAAHGAGTAAPATANGAGHDVEVPKTLVEPSHVTAEQLSPAATLALEQAPMGTTSIYRAADGDPKAVTKKLLADHPDARMNQSTAQLTLPRIDGSQVGQAQTLPQLGKELAQQTGVSAVEVVRNEEANAEIVGSINPRATFAQLVVNKRLEDARNYYVGPNASFSVDDVTIGGSVVQGLKTTINLGAAQARKYLQEWVRTEKVIEVGTNLYAFKPLPTTADLLDPKTHPEYPQWMSGCARIPLPAADAERAWELLIVGMRDNQPANFEAVAASLMRHMSIPANKGGLWSGGEDLSDYARTQGCTALEQQDFYKATQGLTLVNDWPVARQAWAAFSRLYASHLRGKVHVYMRRFAPGSVLVDIELQKINEMLRAPGGVPGGLDLRYHGMEWGDDPRHKLSQPLPGYWRELDAAGNPLGAGEVMEQDQAPAAHAVGVAEARFRAKQAAKP